MALVDSIIGAESGGNADARNPNSSAGGLGQFIDATWLAMLAKHRPDLQGSPDQLLALKSDPQLSREMTEAYAADNGKILTGAGTRQAPETHILLILPGRKGPLRFCPPIRTHRYPTFSEPRLSKLTHSFKA